MKQDIYSHYKKVLLEIFEHDSLGQEIGRFERAASKCVVSL